MVDYGESYKLELRVKTDKREDKVVVSVRLRLLRDDYKQDSIIQLLHKETCLSILFDNEVVEKKYVDLDFKTYNQVMIEYKYESHNEDVISTIIKGKLEVNDPSEYLTDTEIESYLVIPSLKPEPLFIDLTGERADSYIHYYIAYNIEPDYIQYKTNNQDWTLLDSTNFDLPQVLGNQYIQVRGKKDDYFSYSNTIKVVDGIIL